MNQNRTSSRLLTSLCFFPAFTPPKSGGELRHFHLSSRLAEQFPTEMFTPTHPGAENETVRHSANLTEHRFGKSSRHVRWHRLFERWGRFDECSAHVVSLAAKKEADFYNAVRESAAKSQIVYHAFPYLIHLTPKLPGQRFIYDAHNVEADLQRRIMKGSLGKWLARRTQQLERETCRAADLVFAVSEEDRERLIGLYGINPAKVLVAPNGVDIHSVRPPSQSERAEARAFLGLGTEPAALFFASAFPPNTEAARLIIEQIAPAVPEMTFLIAGSVGASLTAPSPLNCRILGRVSEEERIALLRGADLALNPMLTGSGSNLKMLDYLAAGLPCVATPTGARGLNLENGREVWVADPGDFPAILRAAAENPEMAADVAANGRHAAESRFNWDSIAQGMIDAIDSLEQPSMTVANTYPIWPPTFGGPARCFNIYRNLAKDIRISYLCPGPASEKASSREIAPGLTEIIIPKSRLQATLEKFGERLFRCGIEDIACLFARKSSPLGRVVAEQAARSSILVACQPFMAHLLPENGGKPFVLETQNFEAGLKADMLKGPLGRWLVSRVERAERKAAGRSDLVIAVSQEDLRKICASYGPKGQSIVIPNGAEVADRTLASEGDRAALKAQFGLEGVPILIFLGSGHPPNVGAAQAIADCIAPEMPDAAFFIVGDVCWLIDRSRIPRNVKLFYLVSSEARLGLLDLADLAINPMPFGSGTSLKMFDFLAAGLPTLSTPPGTRGIESGENVGIIECPVGEMASRAIEILNDPSRHRSLRANARRFVEKNYDWALIANRFRDSLPEFASQAQSRH